MKSHFKTQSLGTLLILMILVSAYQNFSFSEGWRLNQITINEKARTAHARELLGSRYEGSRAQLVEKSNSLSMSIFNKIYESLPTTHKSYSADLSLALLQEAEKYKIDPVFVLAVIATESSFNPLARGQFGEIGLMQIKPDTAQWIATKYGLEWKGALSLENPISNIKIGMAYFDYLRNRFNGHANKYLSAYNMGAKRVSRLYAEEITPRNYSLRVMKNYQATYRQFSNMTLLNYLADN